MLFDVAEGGAQVEDVQVALGTNVDVAAVDWLQNCAADGPRDALQ